MYDSEYSTKSRTEMGHESATEINSLLYVLTTVVGVIKMKYHEEVLYLQPLIPPKRFDIPPPPNWGMLRRSWCVLVFL